ncbi:MAG: FimV/HubP family polar landmark protein [Woeseiaceae bacterium]|nr:FimV/HubP family polar landmark protein [Woeseiaceae bacterium]
MWDALDADEEADSESVASTERLRALARDDDSAIVVVEGQDHGDTPGGDTIESPAVSPTMSPAADDSSGGLSPAAAGAGGPQESAEPVSLEDTFSSETAINLDQSDPVAEADFHMAYGLYDQAADLINGALAVEPNRTDLMAKLCEIYFVWGNRDAFVDAAQRLHDADGKSGDWDKIVIMGQQIAGDHALFSGASAAGASREVDLDFESGGDDSAALDMDFDTGGGGPDGAASDVIDLGADDAGESDDDLDFSFGDEDEDSSASITREMPGRDTDGDSTVESPTIESEAARDYDDSDATAESPALRPGSDDLGDDPDATAESPTLDKPLDSLDNTSELPAYDEGREAEHDTMLAGLDDGRTGDATAEIDLDDLGLDLDSLSSDFGDDKGLLDDDATGTNLAQDELEETGRNLQADDEARRDEEDLLASTGQTQVLSDDFSVDTTGDAGADLGDDDETMMARVPDTGDDPDFDFAKTEALPKEAYDSSLEETAESPSLAGSTDLDLDLDDLTAALQKSESGDTVDQYRDDETVEQPRAGGRDDEPSLDFDLGMGNDSDDPTQALGPDDVSGDLQEARTMTEVGTKLDLARAYVDMGDPGGARNILEEVLQEGDESQRQQAQKLLDTLPG